MSQTLLHQIGNQLDVKTGKIEVITDSDNFRDINERGRAPASLVEKGRSATSERPTDSPNGRIPGL